MQTEPIIVPSFEAATPEEKPTLMDLLEQEQEEMEVRELRTRPRKTLRPVHHEYL